MIDESDSVDYVRNDGPIPVGVDGYPMDIRHREQPDLYLVGLDTLFWQLTERRHCRD